MISGILRQKKLRWLFAFLALCVPAGAVLVDDDVHIQGHFLEWFFAPDDGGILNTLRILGNENNLAGEEGLLQEGFGVGSYYLPNRRLNERLEMMDQDSGRPMLQYRYECDGPNIKGLHVVRLMEPLPDESSIRVTWTVENKGSESQWVAPWVRNGIRAAGARRLRLPTFDGILDATQEAYYPAARNWAAFTDLERKESVCAVFHADHTHAFLATQDDAGRMEGLQTAFVPRLLNPGEAWTTIYRVNVLRGLDRVDFAADALAAQITYEKGRLSVLFASAKELSGVHIEARIVAENQRVWRLPRKRFDVSPSRLARSTYEWEAPGEGTYEFLAQLKIGDVVLNLGEDTASPHGGMDTTFTVGAPKKTVMEAWTDAPHLLDRGPRIVPGTVAASGDAVLWFASSVEKVFPQDTVKTGGAIDPIIHLTAAGNEYESFQLCIRPKTKAPLSQVRATPEDLQDLKSGARIQAKNISLHNVQYHDIRIPSHYEGPTGLFPDALPEHVPFTAPGGVTTPLWITVHVPSDQPAGIYRGPLTLSSADAGPWEVWIEMHVYDFSLPKAPMLKTDFGFSLNALVHQAKTSGGNAETLARQYLRDALAHRITLRELCQFPRESAAYEKELDTFAQRLTLLQDTGATTFYVPASLLDAPTQLAQADAFVQKHRLQECAFTQLAYEPEEPAWSRILERMQQWKNTAPHIPITVSTVGLSPFIPEPLDIWSVHAQVLDTTNTVPILQRAAQGGQVWWYFNHTPPRPYGNFFIDFAAIEHRILFWQSWALGVRGMQYWNVNAWSDNGNPFETFLDITPVNGDGILIYPGPHGPISSIRWEAIRDGLEDYDYLALFMERRSALLQRGGQDALLKRAAAAYNLDVVVPSLVTFTRDPEVLLAKRREIAEMIVEMDASLKKK